MIERQPTKPSGEQFAAEAIFVEVHLGYPLIVEFMDWITRTKNYPFYSSVSGGPRGVYVGVWSLERGKRIQAWLASARINYTSRLAARD